MRARLFTPENRKWWTLVAVAVGLFMIMLDNTVVNVALPSIQQDLGIGISELEWVVNAYALTFGVLLLIGGKLADRERRRDDREGRRHHQCRAHPLNRACRDQLGAGRGEPAEERRGGEDDQADHEDQPAAEQVAELAAREQQRREGQRIGRNRPLELRTADAELPLDRRQRHVHDRVVEHDHEEREAQRAQRPPLPVLVREDPRPHALISFRRRLS